MAEPTCVMHPFSPEFPIPTPQENNPMCGGGIEESVSFGRFMTENLSWEDKWSSFDANRNRHVEEAKKYSRPGSVAQKKAYFEAHFKRMAALKAAALLEQANSDQGITQDQVHDELVSHEIENSGSISTVEPKHYEEPEVENKDAGFVVHQNQLFSVGGKDKNEVNHVDIVKNVDPIMQNISSNHDVKNSEVLKGVNCNASEEGSGRISQVDITPLQETTTLKEEASTPIVKKNPPLSAYMSSIDGIGRPPLYASSPAKSAASVYPGKENYATPVKPKSSLNDPDKKRTPLRMSINREFNKIMSPVIRKIGSSSKASKDQSTPSKTPAKVSLDGPSEAHSRAPNLAKRGNRIHFDSSACDRHSKTPGSRWNILSTEGFKSPSTVRNKINSPIIPTSFCLNGEERATRRKQKLEEKFNATTTTEKGQPPSKFKEKAEAELNKFRQSFCFKVMSSPDRVNETPKSPLRKASSSTRGKRSHTSTSQKKSSLPPRRPTIKLSGLKTVQKRNN